MDCDNLDFSRKLSKQRIAKAEKALGKTLVRKILAFALFILGVDRTSIASRLDMPPGTVRSAVRSINNDGVAAFLDRRTKTLLPKTEKTTELTPSRVETGGEYLKVVLSDGKTIVQVPAPNRLQKRVVLLTMLNSGILKRSDAATALGLSEDRTAKLARKLGQNDVESVIDRRQGQQMGFRVTPRLKSELIQQFVVDIVAEGSTTGKLLARHLEERCRITISPRTVLHHLSKLGLNHIKWSLPRLLEEAKKKSLKS